MKISISIKCGTNYTEGMCILYLFCVFLADKKTCLTLHYKIFSFNTSEEKALWKYCGKRKKSWKQLGFSPCLQFSTLSKTNINIKAHSKLMFLIHYHAVPSLWEKDNMLVTTIFSFSHNVFLPFQKQISKSYFYTFIKDWTYYGITHSAQVYGMLTSSSLSIA